MTDEELREQIVSISTLVDETGGVVHREFDMDELEQLIKARDAAVRIDQMTEDLGISKASIAVNREELIAELRRESDPKS